MDTQQMFLSPHVTVAIASMRLGSCLSYRTALASSQTHPGTCTLVNTLRFTSYYTRHTSRSSPKAGHTSTLLCRCYRSITAVTHTLVTHTTFNVQQRCTACLQQPSTPGGCKQSGHLRATAARLHSRRRVASDEAGHGMRYRDVGILRGT